MPNRMSMSWPTLLIFGLWAMSSLCTMVNPYQLDPNPASNATGATKSQTTRHSVSTVGRSFYLTIGHRMKGDVSNDLQGHLYRRLGDFPVDSPQQCTLICLSNPQCRSVSYKKSKQPMCHLHDISVDDYVMLVKDPNWDIFTTYEGECT